MESLNSLTLSEVISHFEAWRSTRIGKSRIPTHLWQEAIDLYPSYTVSEITKPPSTRPFRFQEENITA